MIWIMIFVVYLLIGALMGFNERKMIDEVTDELLEKLPIGINKLYFMRAFAILVMLMLPAVRLSIFIKWLPNDFKFWKLKRDIRRDLKGFLKKRNKG